MFALLRSRKKQKSRFIGSSTAVSYLTPDVLKRSNLKIAVNCRVEKILFDKSSDSTSPRAIGVEFRRQRDGPLFRVASKKEVLLCGGAVSSPHVLLLSGLGPREELEKQGVEVVKHIPSVGKGFADVRLHIYIIRTRDSETSKSI